MKRPSSLAQLLAYMFIILGSSFIVLGYFNRYGILPIPVSSIADIYPIFGVNGIMFSMAGLVTYLVSLHRESKGIKLRSTGLKVQGVVTRIRKIKYIKWGKKSPYIIYFYYKRYGFKYEGKSFLVWNRPDMVQGESIDVYINDKRREDSYIEI